jgi:hypothetical protein
VVSGRVGADNKTGRKDCHAVGPNNLLNDAREGQTVASALLLAAGLAIDLVFKESK